MRRGGGRERGHFGHNDLGIVVAIIAVLAAIAIPNLLRVQAESRCYVGLAARLDGTPGRCPVADAPYAIADGALACPDPAHHLGPGRFVQRGAGWVQEHDWPAFALPPGTPTALSDGYLMATTVTVGPDRIVVEETEWWGNRYLLAPLLALALLGSLGVAIWLTVKRERDGPGLLLANVAFSLLWILVYAMVHDRRIEFPRPGGEVRIQHRYFGVAAGETVLTDVRAIYTVNARLVQVLHGHGDARTTTSLFGLGAEEHGALTPILAALTPSR